MARPRLPQVYGVCTATRTGKRDPAFELWHAPTASLKQVLSSRGGSDRDCIVEIRGDAVNEIFRWDTKRDDWQQLWTLKPARFRVLQVLENNEDPDELVDELARMISAGDGYSWDWAKWTVMEVIVRHLESDQLKVVIDDLKDRFNRLNPAERPPWED